MESKAFQVEHGLKIMKRHRRKHHHHSYHHHHQDHHKEEEGKRKSVMLAMMTTRTTKSRRVTMKVTSTKMPNRETRRVAKQSQSRNRRLNLPLPLRPLLPPPASTQTTTMLSKAQLATSPPLISLQATIHPPSSRRVVNLPVPSLPAVPLLAQAMVLSQIPMVLVLTSESNKTEVPIFGLVVIGTFGVNLI